MSYGKEQGNYRPPVWPKNFDPEVLAPLAPLDRVVVHLKSDYPEETDPSVPFDARTRYYIKTRDGKFLYEAIEETNCFLLYVCAARRPFSLQLLDENNREVIHIERKFRCDWMCFPGFLQTLKVQSPPGTTIGRIHQVWNYCQPKFRIADVTEDTLYYIHAPIFTNPCCVEPEFKVTSKDGKIEYGKVTQDMELCQKEKFEIGEFDDKFLVLFAANMDLRLKALQIGNGFLMNSLYYEYTEYEEY